MSRTFTRLLVVLGLCVALGAGTSPAVAAKGHPPMMLGPGDANVSGIGGKALIRMSKWGYVYIAGKHSSRLTIKPVRDGKALRYKDTRTQKLGQIPKRCDRLRAKRGIAVQCRIPRKFRDKMFVQVWPRLGNDYVNGQALPHRFRLWVLADAGRDIVQGGRGNDFVNGAKDADRVWGDRGNDFLRTGPGNDRLYGGKGADRLSCAENHDTAVRDPRDRLSQCERVRRRR